MSCHGQWNLLWNKMLFVTMAEIYETNPQAQV